MKFKIPTLVIVEGPDATGKTSLAKFIARETGSFYYHASGKGVLHDWMMEYHQTILESAEFNLSIGNSVILDRHWPSEHCYGTVLRPDFKGHRDYAIPTILKRLEPLKPIYIFSHSGNSFDRHWDEHAELDHRYSREDYQKIVQEYESLHRRMMHDYVTGVVTNQPILEYSIELHGSDLRGFTNFLISLQRT